MLGVDPEFGASVLRLWVAAGSAALLVVFCALAFFQHRLRLAAHPATGAGFVIAGAAFGAVMTWAFLDRAVSGDATAERRVLEMRAQQLSSQALMPGSPLACLDALAGETVEAACEKALFGSPASVASASAYVGAQLTLLASTVALARHEGVALESSVSAVAAFARKRPLRLCRPCACDSRRLHRAKLQDACAFPRRQAGTHQSDDVHT